MQNNNNSDKMYYQKYNNEKSIHFFFSLLVLTTSNNGVTRENSFTSSWDFDWYWYKTFYGNFVSNNKKEIEENQQLQ